MNNDDTIGLICPLCEGQDYSFYYQDNNRVYNQCARCHLVFVSPQYYLSATEERQIYDLHENSADDLGYRQFLSRVMEPLIESLSPEALGLDFGSGPEPVLQAMLVEQGFDVQVYDIFYAKNEDVLKDKYHFITCTEVVEHLHKPGAVLSSLRAKLKPGGIIALMTKQVIDKQAFSSWHYKNDPTHVCFFSRDTFVWLAASLNMRVAFYGADVILLYEDTECKND